MLEQESYQLGVAGSCRDMQECFLSKVLALLPRKGFKTKHPDTPLLNCTNHERCFCLSCVSEGGRPRKLLPLLLEPVFLALSPCFLFLSQLLLPIFLFLSHLCILFAFLLLLLVLFVPFLAGVSPAAIFFSLAHSLCNAQFFLEQGTGNFMIW